MVTFPEVSAWLQKQDLAKRSQWMTLEEVWAEVDADGSGTLDRNETREVLKAMGYKTYQEQKEAIRELDENGDGSIEWDEFCMWFTKQATEHMQEVTKGERGSDFQVGDRTYHLSMTSEADVVLTRLKKALAAKVYDVMEMATALDSAKALMRVCCSICMYNVWIASGSHVSQLVRCCR